MLHYLHHQIELNNQIVADIRIIWHSRGIYVFLNLLVFFAFI